MFRRLFSCLALAWCLAPDAHAQSSQAVACGSRIEGAVTTGDPEWPGYLPGQHADTYALTVAESGIYRFVLENPQNDASLALVLLDGFGSKMQLPVSVAVQAPARRLLPGAYTVVVKGAPVGADIGYSLSVECPTLAAATCGTVSGTLAKTRSACVTTPPLPLSPFPVTTCTTVAFDEAVLDLDAPRNVEFIASDFQITVSPLSNEFLGTDLGEGRYLLPAGAYLVTSSRSATVQGGAGVTPPVIEDRGYSRTIVCTESDLTPEDALDFLSFPLWVTDGAPAVFRMPVLYPATPSNSDKSVLAMYANDRAGRPHEGTDFGMFRTAESMAALPAGVYRLSIQLDTLNRGGYSPDLRLRVYGPDGLTQQMKSFATNGQIASTISMVWESDGVTPWNIAIDLLAYRPEQSGGFEIKAVRNERVEP